MDNPAESATPTDTTATSTARPVRNSGGVPGASSGGGREDCWSEGATAVLIEAWGERHLRCNRGNLRQTDWREVADAVNGREDGEKASKSDVQCKNRIDTLKKKYKVEKAKSAPSTWPFFGRLDYLIGPGAAGKKAGSGGSGVNFTPKQRPSRFRLSSSPNLNPNSSGGGAIPKPRSGALAVLSGGSSSRLNSVDSSDSESSLGGGENGKGPARSVGRKHSRLDDFVNSPVEETAFKELAKAILKFGEIYERIENSKQRQMMELERQRMEFTKELEFQRMNMLMEAQLEIEKVKRSKNASNSGETSNKL